MLNRYATKWHSACKLIGYTDTIRKYKHGGYPMNLSAKNKKTVVDPVCGMAVVPDIKEIITTIDGETYYFCAEGCRQSFEENPQKFLNPRLAKKKGLWADIWNVWKRRPVGSL